MVAMRYLPAGEKFGVQAFSAAVSDLVEDLYAGLGERILEIKSGERQQKSFACFTAFHDFLKTKAENDDLADLMEPLIFEFLDRDETGKRTA
jgi:hypothetical protein